MTAEDGNAGKHSQPRKGGVKTALLFFGAALIRHE